LRAEVRVENECVARIGGGVLILLGVMRGDDLGCAQRLAERVVRFRYFADDTGRMNRSILEAGGGALVVSQFTLAADGRKGRRPSFDRAAPPEEAETLYLSFCDHMAAMGVPTRTGEFGAMMQVELINDGPVTFLLEETNTSSTRG
jgi:D-tyrosyl-tRNA(Tyr) deacylase